MRTGKEIKKLIEERFKGSFEIKIEDIETAKLLVIFSKNGIITDFEMNYISDLARKEGLMYYFSFLETMQKLYIAIKLNDTLED